LDAKSALQGVSVVLTRSPGKSRELTFILESLGARVVEKPLIDIWPICEDETLRSLSLPNLYDGVIVTSANAVHSAFTICQNSNQPLRFESLTWYCIGKGTAKAATGHGIKPIVFENVRNGQDFVNALIHHLRGSLPCKLAFLHGQKADLSHIRLFQSVGVTVHPIVVYNTVDARVDIEELYSMQQSGIVVYVFFSPSAVQSLIRQWPDFNENRTYRTFVVTIGQTTCRASKDLHVVVDKVAAKPTSTDVADAIVAAVSH
jgi:uroporphyrinogen-III synthase